MLNCNCNIVCEPSPKLIKGEKSLYLSWLEQSFQQEFLQTLDDEKISIINPGIRNETEGPDFSEALVLINDEFHKGDIEIHLNNGDWYNHKHDKDKKYNNVVLHVVANIDTKRSILTANEKIIPVLELPANLEIIEKEYSCEAWGDIKIDGFFETINDYSEKRFQRKCFSVQDSIMQFDAEQFFYISILDVMGYSKNRMAFKKLAQILPISQLYNILDKTDEEQRLHILEICLYGISGLLNPEYDKYFDNIEYLKSLKKSWNNVQKRFGISEIIDQRLHFAGSRPANHPHKRLASLAQILSNIYPEYPGQLCLNIISSGRSEDKMIELFKKYFQLPSGMWCNHPLFRQQHGKVLIGEKRLMDMISNVFLPFCWALGSIKKETFLIEKTLAMSRNISVGAFPGKIEKMLNRLNIPKKNINTNFQLQGCIEFYRLFCEMNLCKLCPIENNILIEKS